MAPTPWRGIIDAYRAFLPQVDQVVTLHEGATPLIPSPGLSRRLGRPVWLKIEGSNPNGSFKDRGMTAAYEICDVLGQAPASVVLPVGNGGNITAYWAGFRRYQAASRISRLPRMIGVQAEGANPLLRGVPVERPQTVASAIRIGRPANWSPAVEAATASGGCFVQVTDTAIIEAQRALAAEGVFVEPASAAAMAGALALGTDDLPDGDLVCILTGHGLKDPDVAVGREPIRLPASLDALRAMIEQEGEVRWA